MSLTGNYKLFQHDYPPQKNGPQVWPVEVSLAKGALLHKMLVWFGGRADWIMHELGHVLPGLNCI